MKVGTRWIVVCVVLAGVLAGSAWAVEETAAVRLVERVGGDVIGFVGTSGGDALEDAFGGTIVGQMWRDPQTKGFVAGVWGAARQALASEEGEETAGQVEAALELGRLCLRRPMAAVALWRESGGR